MDSHRPTMPDDPALVGYQPNPAASPGSFPARGVTEFISTNT